MSQVARILVVNFSYGGGGSELVASQLCLGLNRERFEPIACYLQWRGEGGIDLESSGVKVIGIGRKLGRRPDYFAFRNLRRIIVDHKIDLVHSHSTDSLADSAVCRILTPGLKHVHTFHYGNYPHYERNLRLIERLFCKVPDRLVAVGQEQRKAILATYPVPTQRLVTIRNGIEPTKDEVDPLILRRFSGTDHVLIGSICNLIEQKGLDSLLLVAQTLHAHGLRVRFVIAGDGPLRDELLKSRDRLGLKDVVEFLGRVPNAACRLLPLFDIYFQPSRWEAMSMSLLEAMMAAKPIVATDVGEARHMIQPGVTGILVQPNGVAGMVAAIHSLIADPEGRARMGRTARAVASTSFSASTMVRQYERLYDEVLRR